MFLLLFFCFVDLSGDNNKFEGEEKQNMNMFNKGHSTADL